MATAQRPPKNLFILRALGGLWLATGGIFLAAAGKQASEPFKSMQWASTPGTIIDAQVVHRKRDRSVPFLGDSSAYAFVRYRYVVDGVVRHSTRYSFPQLSLNSERGARAIASQFQPNESVTVWYDPQQPSDAVLHRGLSWITIALFVAGFILVAVGGRWMRTRLPRTGAPPVVRRVTSDQSRSQN